MSAPYIQRMPFPIMASPGDDPRQFRIQDPFGLRRAVIPLLESNPITNLFDGLGTAFRIDPFGTFLSAQHVVEHRIDASLKNRDSGSVVVGLLGMGLGYGCPPVPRDCFCTIAEVATFRGRVDNPVLELQGRAETRNVFDCIQLRLDPANIRLRTNVVSLPVRLRRSNLRIGEKLLAIGFPEIASVRNENLCNVARYSEQMFGALAEVSELFPNGRSVMAPWPSFGVTGHWPLGMSGGPIFSSDGEVVGLVSSGLDPTDTDEGRGFGFWFEPIAEVESWLATLDPDNPGWIRGWIVISSNNNSPIVCFPDRAQAELCSASSQTKCSVHYGSMKYGTGDFITFD